MQRLILLPTNDPITTSTEKRKMDQAWKAGNAIVGAGSSRLDLVLAVHQTMSAHGHKRHLNSNNGCFYASKDSHTFHKP